MSQKLKITKKERIVTICKFCEIKDMLDIDCQDLEDFPENCPALKLQLKTEAMAEAVQELGINIPDYE